VGAAATLIGAKAVSVKTAPEAAPIEESSAHKIKGALAASARCKTAPGDGSEAQTLAGQ